MKHWACLTFLLIIATASCTPSSATSSPTTPSPAVSTEPGLAIETMPLRQLADKQGILIGSQVNVGILRYDDKYTKTVKQEFNVLVPEVEMKFAFLHQAKEMYYFRDSDYLVDFAQKGNMKVRGHTLLWHQFDPEWIQTGNFTKGELIEILRDHINAVVGRYKGRIFAWDVVNEGINDDGTLRDTVWLRSIGPEYIDLAFQFAHNADPDATLFYNDYEAEGLGAKADAVFALVKSLRERNVPINGVGLQLHVTLNEHPSAEELSANIERLSKLGLIVHITEMDVRLHQPATADELDAQAQIFKDVFETCLSEKACQAFIMWGFTDKYSWIKDVYPGFGDAHILDNTYKPKPAYYVLKEVLLGKISSP
ncbi:MAG: endo-1,4-beta-xylanase [Chloroflexi bacterium]|nr:endo-1,4-beta-xylanase [Chloroflexota bacterium]